jgi:hypothetical protein
MNGAYMSLQDVDLQTHSLMAASRHKSPHQRPYIYRDQPEELAERQGLLSACTTH